MASNAFERLLGTQNDRLVRLLDENRSVSAYIHAVLDHVANYALDKGVPFSQIEIELPFAHDDQLRGRLRVRL